MIESEAMTIVAQPSLRRRTNSRLYAWMACGAILAVFVGFALTFYLQGYFVLRPDQPLLTPLLIVHGLVGTLWMALFLIARGRLHHPCNDDLRVASDEFAERARFRDFAPEIRHTHSLAIGVRHLNERVTGSDGVRAEKRFDTKHPFIANRCCFDHRAVRLHGRNRRNPAVEKIHGVKCTVPRALDVDSGRQHVARLTL